MKKRSFIDRYFGFVEKLPPSDKFIYLVVLTLFITAALGTALAFNNSQKITIATSGGTLREGIIGTPRFVNPVLAITRADRDVVALVYSGLMRLGSDGKLHNDLAESITISDDGTVYNIILRESVSFHDGNELTTEDVAYTIGLIQDPTLKSPLRGNWNGVTVEVIDDREVNFVLEEPYEPFIENLTVGILPKHIWSGLSIEQLPFSQHNTEPIGTGPYELGNVTYNTSGLIEDYILEATEIHGTPANISKIAIHFYQNEQLLLEAFAEGKIDSTAALSYESLRLIDTDVYTVVQHPLPRVFSIFLNQNKTPAFRDSAAREALSVAIDREDLIDVVLGGYGVPTDSPVPPGFIPVEFQSTSTIRATTTPIGVRAAESILIEGGWEQQEDTSWQKEIDGESVKLAVSITTANSEVFEETAEYIKAVWEQLGVEVSLALFEQTDLVQVIIRPRAYQALLFGTDIGRSLDLYPFWHSSQKDDPGLNVSLYANITTDDLLETARTTQNAVEKYEAIQDFETEVTEEKPALFLYSPSFTYIVKNNVSVASIERVVDPSERFTDIETWHMEQSNVWPFFAN